MSNVGASFSCTPPRNWSPCNYYNGLVRFLGFFGYLGLCLGHTNIAGVYF